MKKIIISISDSFVERNLLKTDFLKSLVDSKIKIYCVSSNESLYKYLINKYKEWPIEFIFEPYVISKVDAFFNLLFANSIHTNSVKENQWNYLKGHNRKREFSLLLFVFFRVAWFLGKFSLWRKFLRFFYGYCPNNYCKDLLRKIKPNLVFITSINPSDYKLGQQLKKMKVKNIQMIKSWDNLTTKTFLKVLPDYLIVHNETMKNEAINLFDMPKEKIFISGIPQFDYLFKNKSRLIIKRDEFYRNIKVNPEKSILLFCASGDEVSPNDEDFLVLINDAIKEGRIKNAQVQVRSHPKFVNNWKKIKTLENVVVERPFTYYNNNSSDWIFEESDMVHWLNSIYHSSIVMNVASSMSIDASVLDRPVICLGFDGRKKIIYDKSISRYYDREHYRNLIKTGGVDLVKNENELIEAINNYLDNPTKDKQERENIVKQQCYKLDGNSSKRIVEFLEKNL